MLRKLTLSLILTASAFAVSTLSFATTYVDNGTSNPYTLNAGDSLFIASGTYTGAISGLGSVNAKITVNSGATFQPSSFPNNAVATMEVYGTAIFGYNIRTNTGFTLNNYGIFSVSGTVTINGNNQTWTNSYGGTMNFYDNVTMNGDLGNNNTFVNYETVNCTGTFKMNSGSAFYNYKNFYVTGTFQANGGVLNNEGKLDVTGNIQMNSGTSVIRNYCMMKATTGFNNTNGNFYNYSFLWAVNSDISNSATIINVVTNHSTPMIQGRNFTLSTGGSITGPCLMYFDGTTSHTGGTIGVPGVTTDTIKVYDITRTQPTQIFDVQSGGTRYPNVIYNAWGVPDPTYVWFWGCSYVYIQNIPLAISWNSFYVTLTDNIPVLNWSADYDQGTVFEIQRSYDGVSFQGIKDMASEYGRSEYIYDDKLVNNQSSVVYYRIKATGLNGAEKYSEIRTVRFKNNRGITIYTAPNPFTSNFNIDYTATEKEMITIRMFNISGQQKFTKNMMVNKGNNIINITEAARLASGVYVIQVSNDQTILSTNKMIKQ